MFLWQVNEIVFPVGARGTGRSSLINKKSSVLIPVRVPRAGVCRTPLFRRIFPAWRYVNPTLARPGLFARIFSVFPSCTAAGANHFSLPFRRSCGGFSTLFPSSIRAEHHNSLISSYLFGFGDFIIYRLVSRARRPIWRSFARAKTTCPDRLNPLQPFTSQVKLGIQMRNSLDFAVHIHH